MGSTAAPSTEIPTGVTAPPVPGAPQPPAEAAPTVVQSADAPPVYPPPVEVPAPFPPGAAQSTQEANAQFVPAQPASVAPATEELSQPGLMSFGGDQAKPTDASAFPSVATPAPPPASEDTQFPPPTTLRPDNTAPIVGAAFPPQGTSQVEIPEAPAPVPAPPQAESASQSPENQVDIETQRLIVQTFQSTQFAIEQAAKSPDQQIVNKAPEAIINGALQNVLTEIMMKDIKEKNPNSTNT